MTIKRGMQPEQNIIQKGSEASACLFASHGYDLRDKLRNRDMDDSISDYLSAIWQGRTDQNSVDRALGKPMKQNKIEMSYIGS